MLKMKFGIFITLVAACLAFSNELLAFAAGATDDPNTYGPAWSTPTAGTAGGKSSFSENDRDYAASTAVTGLFSLYSQGLFVGFVSLEAGRVVQITGLTTNDVALSRAAGMLYSGNGRIRGDMLGIDTP